MSLKRSINLLPAFFVLIGGLYAQSGVPGWEEYTSMKDVRGVSVSGNTVWAASTGGLFSFDINTLNGSIKKYTSLDGLLSNELNSGTIDNSGRIWNGGVDGSISVLDPGSGQWRVVTDIQQSTEPSKSINGFFLYSNFMFIATEFCIVKFDVARFQFIDQPYIYLGNMPVKTPVYETLVINDTIWAATKNGIAYANINNNLPIGSNWSNFTTANSVMRSNLTSAIAYFGGKVYFGTDSGMVYYNGDTLSVFQPLYNGNPVTDPVKEMAVSNGVLYFSTYKSSLNIFKVDNNNLNQAQLVLPNVRVNSLKVTQAGDLLIGTERDGVDIFRNNSQSFVVPNGPFSNIFYSIDVSSTGDVWGVSGSLGDWSEVSGVYRFRGNLWKNFTFANNPVIGNGCCGWFHIYCSKFNPVVWASGFGNGLLKIMGDSVYRFDDGNSILKQYGGAGFVLVSGLTEDINGNVWLTNPFTEKPIVNFSTGSSYPLPVGNSFTIFPDFLAIDNYNTKWMTLHNVEGNQRGVMYFNENSDPSGNILSYNVLGSDISSVNDITVDRNGEVWIATNNGVVIIPDPSQVINEPGSIPTHFKMRIIESGISTPLTENVLSIEVDALNNKWLGTFANGLLYVSIDGSILLGRYNESNSPLIDNRISSISMDHTTGKVYFGTEKGLNSYQTVAVQPLEECDKITAGPNPFLIPNDKLLRIDGLVAESTVKILSISGRLVHEFESPGGRVANWDGRDTYGNLVPSGVYIIVGFNNDGEKVCTGKVAVVRR